MKSLVSMMQAETPNEFNEDLLNSSNDYKMEDLVLEIMKELEVIENIKMTKYEVIRDQDEIDYNMHTININYKKKDMDIKPPNYKYISANRYIQMNFYYDIKTNKKQKSIMKPILIPIPDRDGNYLVGNKKWRLIWQILEASTYTGLGRITLKPKMPIIIYTQKNWTITDCFGDQHQCTNYSYALETARRKNAKTGAKKRVQFIPPLMILSAKLGLTEAIKFMGYDGLVKITDTMFEDTDEFWYFPIDELFAKVEKKLLEDHPKISTILGMLSALTHVDFPVNWENKEDQDYWACRLGLIGSIKGKNKNIDAYKGKGYTTLYMIEQLVPNIDINNLRLPMCYKRNVYYIFRWMIENFEELRSISNMDMNHKRIRKNEYVVRATLGKKVAQNINRFIESFNRPRKNEIDTILTLFNFSSKIILNGMPIINDLVKSSELTNDFTFLTDIMYSNKGPNSLGETSAKTIAVKYRALDPSMVGKIDINVSSNSDPGMSGMLTPFTPLYDRFFFSPDWEPCDKHYELDLIKKEYFERTKDKRLRELKKIPMNTFEEYLEYIEKTDTLIPELKYCKIELVEKEDDPDSEVFSVIK